MSSSKVYKSIEVQTEVIERKPLTPMVLHGRKPIEVRNHCHHPRSEDVDTGARNKLYLASVTCFTLMVLEIIGGILSNSLAVALDAAHLGADLASFLIALFAIWIAKRPATQRLNFGWYRAEVIGALISVFIIWLLAGSLCFMAVKRIITGSYEIDPVIMMITAALGAICDFTVGMLLHLDLDCGKCRKCYTKKTQHIENEIYHPKLLILTSSDSLVPMQISSSIDYFECNLRNKETQTSREYLSTKNTKSKSLPLKAAFLNAMGDMIQSIGVFIAGVIIYYEPSWVIVDPILTFIFAFIVLVITLGIIRQALMVLMESTPTFLDYDEIREFFLSVKGVKDVHNLRIWALNLDKVACIVHLEIEEDTNPIEILEQANQAIHQRYHFFETTIQIE